MRAPTRLPRYAALAFALLTLGSCSEATAPEVFNPLGTLSFAYSGALTGTFVASGAVELANGVIEEVATGATAIQEDTVITIVGFKSLSGTAGDAFILNLGVVPAAGGMLGINPLACDQENIGLCRVGVFLPGISAADFGGEIDAQAFLAQSYVFGSGSVTVTSRTELRVKGTFQGLALKADAASPLQGILNIVSGTFDLPIRKVTVTP